MEMEIMKMIKGHLGFASYGEAQVQGWLWGHIQALPRSTDPIPGVLGPLEAGSGLKHPPPAPWDVGWTHGQTPLWLLLGAEPDPSPPSQSVCPSVCVSGAGIRPEPPPPTTFQGSRVGDWVGHTESCMFMWKQGWVDTQGGDRWTRGL